MNGRQITVTEPFSLAWDRMVRICFRPFQPKKWFVLGFCLFLSLLSGGGGNNFGCNWVGRSWTPPTRMPTSAPAIPNSAISPLSSAPGIPGTQPSGPTTMYVYSSGPAFQFNVAQWVESNYPLLIFWAALGACFVIALSALLQWLGARGNFMFLDGVVRNRGAVVEPWRAFRAPGNSLFKFQFVVGLFSFAFFVATVAIGAWLAWPDIRAEQFGTPAINGILVGGGLFGALLLFAIVLQFLLHDLVVPTMYVRRQLVLEAFGTVWRELLPGNKWKIFLYFLMKFVLGIATNIAAMLVMCATCCLATLPYLSCVFLLPIFVFFRTYNLHFIEQFGPQWRAFIYDPTNICGQCGYDLTGNVTGRCPECGNAVPPQPPLAQGG